MVEKKDNNSILHLVLTLTVIGILSAFILSFVYQWTDPHIERHRLEAQEDAIFSVLPETVEYDTNEIEDLTFFEGFSEDGRNTGIAVLIEGNGFQGPIELMVGTDPERGIIHGITILEHQETPGLGARITENEFLQYFEEKAFGEYRLVDQKPEHEEEVQAISGATVSAESVVEIVEQAIEKVQEEYGGGL